MVDGLGAGGEPALQQGEREADGVLALAVQIVRAVHLVADIVGDSRVKGVFQSREGVVDGVGAALGEQRGTVELEEVFLDHASHHVGHVHLVGTFAELAVEAVGVQQG